MRRARDHRAAYLPPSGHARPSPPRRQHWPHGFARPRGTGIIRAAAVVCAAVGLAAILYPSGSGSIALAPPEQPDLTAAVVPAVDSAGFFVALHEGLFIKNGLRVRFIPAISSETVVGAQEAGQISISCGNYVSFIHAQETRKADLDIFAEGSVMKAGAQGYVVPGNGFPSLLRDLKGGTIAINAPGNILYLLAASVLAEDGIPPGQVHFVVPPGGFPTMLAWLREKRVDAAVLPEPFASIAGLSFGATPLADLDQGATANFPEQGCAATKAWGTAHPRMLAAFLAAYQQGQQLADTSRPKVEEALESLPAPYGLTPVQAAVVALDS